MLKVGVIGLGDIAQKAYLPILNKKEVEFHLFTRDQTKLREIGLRYRFTNLHESLDSIVSAGIHAAFVHTSTVSHEEIVTRLLDANIHVFVDKPLTYHYASTEKLLSMAKAKGLVLDLGFNRRHAPVLQELKGMRDINMIVMQKNRKSLPADTRTFIFDDFIHVVDTLLYLMPRPLESMVVSGRKNSNLLYHVVVQLMFEGGRVALGIMNRDAGTAEEKVEVFTAEEKRIVYNVSDMHILKDKSDTKIGRNDWEPTLTTRGFAAMVDGFLQAVQLSTRAPAQDYLLTHKVCEEIVNNLESM
jgi:virulence factor